MTDQQAAAPATEARPRRTIRDVASSYWTMSIVLVLAVIGHAWWYTRGGQGGEVISAFGAALIAIGLVLVGAGYLSPEAINRATSSLMPQDRRMFAMPHDPAYDAALKRAWVDIRASVIKERVVAGFLIALGTVLNGYGPVIARGLGHLYHLHSRGMGHG